MTESQAESPILSKEAHRRSLAKAVSWRVLGSIDTFLISWLVTGHPVIAATISAIEVFTKIFLFYGHERVWGRIRWGRKG
ncbi:MAG: DUF2061 domain-containing protein [Rickettsiales bacterium]|nr:DUF2061 domain-containing protein [Rickettsiales bacterium]